MLVQNQKPYAKFQVVFLSRCFGLRHLCASRWEGASTAGNHFITDRRRGGTEVGQRKKPANREPQRKREREREREVVRKK